MIKDDASLKLDRDIYDKKNQELSEQLKKLQAEQLQLVELSKNQESIKTRIKEFRKNLNSGELLENFDRMVFESVVERIIIGGYNDEGLADPLKITFVYKTGIHSNLNAKDFVYLLFICNLRQKINAFCKQKYSQRIANACGCR